jgi:hypothetical protein
MPTLRRSAEDLVQLPMLSSLRQAAAVAFTAAVGVERSLAAALLVLR